MVTKRNSKTGGGESDYSSRATESIDRKSVNKAIILINKRTNLNFSNYTMPLANLTKYPLF